MTDEEKNFNPTGKELFVLYECPNCGRNDNAIVPPKMKFDLPFWVQCGCGGWVMYARAWICEPYKASDIMVGFMAGDKEIIEALRHELKDATLLINPNGTMTMLGPRMMMRSPEFRNFLECLKRDVESKEKAYR